MLTGVWVIYTVVTLSTDQFLQLKYFAILSLTYLTKLEHIHVQDFSTKYRSLF